MRYKSKKKPITRASTGEATGVHLDSNGLTRVRIGLPIWWTVDPNGWEELLILHHAADPREGEDDEAKPGSRLLSL